MRLVREYFFMRRGCERFNKIRGERFRQYEDLRFAEPFVEVDGAFGGNGREVRNDCAQTHDGIRC